MIGRRALLAACGALLAPDAWARDDDAVPALPIGLHVVAGDEAPAQEWLDAQLAAANRLLAPQRLSVVAAWRRELPAERALLENAADRDALARSLVGGAINAFVVARLRDVDDPRRLRMGVRWRLRSDLAKDYVIVATRARESVLCHELGHLLGLPHSFVVDNVMSYRREHPERLAFDAAQGRVMRRAARALWATGRLAAR